MTVQIISNDVSARLKRTLGRKDEAKAEILEWIGTAYGRRREAKVDHPAATQQTDAAYKPAAQKLGARNSRAHNPGAWWHWSARALAVVDLKHWQPAVSRHFKSGVVQCRTITTGHLTACVALLACATAAAALVLIHGSMPDATSAATTDLVAFADAAPLPHPAPLAAPDQSAPVDVPTAAATPEIPSSIPSAIPSATLPAVADERPAIPELQEATRAAADAKAQLSSERDARVEAEAQAATLVTQAASLKFAREKAETALASMGAELNAARQARQDAEAAARVANDALSRKEQQAAQSPAPAVTPPKPADPAVSQTRALSAHAPRARAFPARLNTASTSSGAGNAAFLAGWKLVERDDLPAARLQFEKAVKAGLPEAALALGNTYDPVSLARTGSARAGDPDHARQWYRRAYALALRQQQP